MSSKALGWMNLVQSDVDLQLKCEFALFSIDSLSYRSIQILSPGILQVSFGS